MRAFAELFNDLDSTTSTKEKVVALKKYFAHQSDEDSMWTVLLLTGRISRRILTGRDLRHLFLIATKYPEWLLEECGAEVGDTAETLSLLANTLDLCRPDDVIVQEFSLTQWMEQRIPDLAKIEDEEEQASVLKMWWRALSQSEVFIVNKLITGAFRVGVSEKLVVRALAELHEIPSDQVAHRLTGASAAGRAAFRNLISKDVSAPTFSQPYPFCLANSWADRSKVDYNPGDWCVEWKYDGIRSQVIAREGKIWIWSRGEEDITESFPDLRKIFDDLPDGTVLDGEIVIMRAGQVQSFNELQGRLGRKKVSAGILKEKPAGFVAYDCLEFSKVDVRSRTLRERRRVLEATLVEIESDQVQLSAILRADDSESLQKLREEARNHQAEGVMIKNWSSVYAVGRKTGNWWKFKIDPLTLDAVLLYAQSGTGRRANLYTDYTFALRTGKGLAEAPKNQNEVGHRKKVPNELGLVPFAKAYSGLDQKEIDELDAWIRTHTKEKFGPVRSVEAHHVFEIGFEGIAKSPRHKSGIAVRFPRILRWRRDKKPEDADDLETAENLLKSLQGVF